MNQCKKCLKFYQHRQSLWKHKQKCCVPKEDVKLNDVINQESSSAKKADTSDDQIATLKSAAQYTDDSSMDEDG
jgi:hypothetical protein